MEKSYEEIKKAFEQNESQNNSKISEVENSLMKLNNQLSTLVCTFEQNNGQLTKTFVEHDDKENNLQIGGKQRVLEINNLSEIHNTISIKEIHPNIENKKEAKGKYSRKQVLGCKDIGPSKALKDFRKNSIPSEQKKQKLNQILERKPEENAIESDSENEDSQRFSDND